jgi:hypothetical protein
MPADTPGAAPPNPGGVAVDIGAAATVYVCSDADPRDATLAALTSWLDARRVLAVSRLSEAVDGERAARAVLEGCDGVVAITSGRIAGGAARAEVDSILKLAGEAGRPVLAITRAERDAVPEADLEDYLAEIMRRPRAGTPYAFLATRIHDDFALIRDAIQSAVETSLGIPCVWFDDPRVVAAAPGVRERTRALIAGAALVAADLTFGPGNRDHDSPNTAHEIGMTLAYERPLILSCRHPRRDLYFSAGDLSTLFWHDEAHLREQLVEWLGPRRATLGRRVLNFDLAESVVAFRPRAFAMDAARAYCGPGPAPRPRSILPATIVPAAGALLVGWLARHGWRSGRR